MSQKLLKNCLHVVNNDRGEIIALKFNILCVRDETTWIPTPTGWGIQIGVFRHRKGYSVRPHYHLREPRGRHIGCEALYVVRGKVRVKLFDEETREELGELVLGPNDIIAMCSAHSLEVLEDAIAVEVKEGPYPGQLADKRYLGSTT